ncbi:MAG: hypothetical protein ACRD4S_06090 [Candidatus Acidiferrales bacterium]
MSTKIYVSISGGCYQCAEKVPEGIAIEVIDWDNVLGDGGTAEEWERFDAEARQFIRGNYPKEYQMIQDRLPRDRRDVI